MQEAVSLINSVVALIVSIIALIYTVRSFLLKSGTEVRASYCLTSSVSCEDEYVGSLTLENFKDRSLVIYRIFLQVGHNYFIEIEEFDRDPLILKPFEVFHKKYDPIDLYSVSSKKIIMKSLLKNRKIKQRIVLSTSDGKYIVKDHIKSWNPISDFFKNHLTATVRPMRSTYKGKSYGGNVKFLVDIKIQDDKEEVIAIYPRDYEIKKFRNFNLTKESLDSKDNLEEHLYEQVSLGKLHCKDIVVHEMEGWRNEVYEMQNEKVITAEYYSWLYYRVAGKFFTILSDLVLKYKNRKVQRAHRKLTSKSR